MKKLYNNINDLIRDIYNFFSHLDIPISIPNLKNISSIVPSLIKAESIVTVDIAKNKVNSINLDSVQKRIYRFFNNTSLDSDFLFKTFIRKIISSVVFKHKKAFITIDHSWEKNNFVALVFTLRVNEQGIPIFFINSKTKDFCKTKEDFDKKRPIFITQTILVAIDQVVSYFAGMDVKLKFQADRWFGDLDILRHIESLGHYYNFKMKSNSDLNLKYQFNFENNETWYKIKHFTPKVHASKYYENIIASKSNPFKTNLVVSRTLGQDEGYYLFTNDTPRDAVRDYNKRFGAIESFFKNIKTNGFNLEKTRTKNIETYDTLYTLLCIATIWLVVIGANYIKNYNHRKAKFNVRFAKKEKNGEYTRILSNFNLCLTLFNAYLSNNNVTIKTNFILYI